MVVVLVWTKVSQKVDYLECLGGWGTRIKGTPRRRRVRQTSSFYTKEAYRTRLEVYGLWFMVYGVWFMVYGLWCMVYGLWFKVYGLWFMAYGLWFLVFGLGAHFGDHETQREECS